MHEITSQPLDQAQHERVRWVQGWADIKEQYAHCLGDESQLTSQAHAMDKDPGAPIFDKDDLGIVVGAREIVPRLIEDIKRQRAGA